jgi:hypothetical protein
MGQALLACEFCKRQNEIASQDYDAQFLNELLGGVEESKDQEYVEMDSTLIFGEDSLDDKLAMWRQKHQEARKMQAEAAKYTNLTPQKRERIEGVECTIFKPFDYSKRIRPTERDDFKEFVKMFF